MTSRPTPKPAVSLPPGQHAIDSFPCFGLPRFAARVPRDIAPLAVAIAGDVGSPITLTSELATLPRHEQVSDFHCVTTWSRLQVRWGGWRFADFYRQLVPLSKPEPDAQFVVFRGRDTYAVSLPLEDLLAPDVLLADQLDGAPLGRVHGGPLRLVAPAHYGYKNPKYLTRIEFWRDDRRYRPAAFRFMDHPRARVALEERGRGVPGAVLRRLYRPFINSTIRRFRRGLA